MPQQLHHGMGLSLHQVLQRVSVHFSMHNKQVLKKIPRYKPIGYRFTIGHDMQLMLGLKLQI
jgi:hypothetical protein